MCGFKLIIGLIKTAGLYTIVSFYQQRSLKFFMKINIKTPDEIEKMRIAGRLASEVLEMIGPHVKAGVTTDELNDICHNYIVKVQDAVPAPLNYQGFPKSICTSLNYQVCHGIPGPR